MAISSKLILSKFIALLCVVFLFGIGNFSEAKPTIKPLTCPVCTVTDRAKCPVLKAGKDCELIPEPNCGCCKMCAKKAGENCGVATGICETGLECIPEPLSDEEYRDYGAANYFMDVLLGKFVCVTRAQFVELLSGAAYGEDSNVGGDGNVYIPELYNPGLGFLYPEIPTDTETSHNNHNTQGNGKVGGGKEQGVILPSITEVVDTTSSDEPLKSPYRSTPEPCTFHADRVWSKEHFDHHEWLPSCSDDGYYLQEQCELSFGLERGRCWCVDHMGDPVSKFLPEDRAYNECRPEFNKT